MCAGRKARIWACGKRWRIWGRRWRRFVREIFRGGKVLCPSWATGRDDRQGRGVCQPKFLLGGVGRRVIWQDRVGRRRGCGGGAGGEVAVTGAGDQFALAARGNYVDVHGAEAAVFGSVRGIVA